MSEPKANPDCAQHAWAWTRPLDEPVPNCWVGTCFICRRVTIEVISEPAPL